MYAVMHEFRHTSACMSKSSFVTGKLCKVHMRVFEIVVCAHRNVDNWTK